MDEHCASRERSQSRHNKHNITRSQVPPLSVLASLLPWPDADVEESDNESVLFLARFLLFFSVGATAARFVTVSEEQK